MPHTDREAQRAVSKSIIELRLQVNLLASLVIVQLVGARADARVWAAMRRAEAAKRAQEEARKAAKRKRKKQIEK